MNRNHGLHPDPSAVYDHCSCGFVAATEEALIDHWRAQLGLGVVSTLERGASISTDVPPDFIVSEDGLSVVLHFDNARDRDRWVTPRDS